MSARDGRLESEVLPLDETVIGVEVTEAALRQGGICYPDLIQGDVYGPKSLPNRGRA
ncbi:uncharacterized protein B0T15DRAFT_541219 [Chaetomium strumarium]|uniref:Uncharacterized protein n=1 Tax=Chaetomium strumarium TaxID=1170767 RepID=A0AAJ0GPM2_9PEZI|nr:hypothetical protein B0T15DRAFT_541219 [Chaetomium strumarium]